MKAIHNTYSDEKIEKFDFVKLGENTFENASDFYYAITSMLGIWFADKKLDIYETSYEYNVDDDNFLVVDDVAELVDIVSSKIYELVGAVDGLDLMEKENRGEARNIAKKLRESFLAEDYAGIYINNDREFDCTSLIAIDLTVIS